MENETAKPRPTILGGIDPVREQSYQAVIHCVVSRIGRHFGFQAFNQDSRTEGSQNPQWTPATIFLVVDHLHHLLVKNYMRRDKAPGSNNEKFERAVHRLHGAIFQAYNDWCDHVVLPSHLPEHEYQAIREGRGNVLLWEYLLEELALYFLIYSEAANVRHMPEALWFIFWITRNSRRMLCVTGFPYDDSRSAANAAVSEERRGIIRKQKHLRNKYHRNIESLRSEMMIKGDGDYTPVEKLEENMKYAFEKLKPLFPKALLELSLLTDMVIYGDSGVFLNRIIEPIFNYLAEEVDEKGSKGRDIQWRVAYDDCNESLCSKENVHKVLARLGVKFSRKKKLMRNKDQEPGFDAYESLLHVGDVFSGKDHLFPPQTLGWSWKIAKDWWANTVFAKTFIERRSWLTMGRAFFRIWLLLILEFQGMCIFLWAFDESSGSYKDRYYWLTTLVATHAGANLLYEIAGAWTQRSTCPKDSSKTMSNETQRVGTDLKLHGNPFWRHYALGILLWLGICGGLVFAFLSQWYNFFDGLELWWYVAGGYTGYVVLHAVLSQRDGYCVSLNQSIANFLRSCYLGPIAYVFELAAYLSARGPNEHFLMPYKMKTGWGPFFSNMIFWIFVIGAKGVFDWFAVMATMKDSVLALMNAGWLGGTEIIEDIEYNADPEIPPIITYRTEQKFDIDIILVIGRVLPGFIVMMNNMQIFYYIFGSIVGVAKGLIQLNLGSITSFQEIVMTFHKTPGYWWNRCISLAGKSNIRDQVKSALASEHLENAPGSFDKLNDAVRHREAFHASLVSEQLVDATSMLSKRIAKSDSTNHRLHLKDETLPQWLAFADIWNGIVDELRSIDLISNAESQNLRFIHITLDDTTEVVQGMRPIMLPVFFYGGQITRALESPGGDPTQGAVLSELRSLLVFILAQTGIITSEQADAFARFQPLLKARNLEQRTKRAAGVQKVIKLLTTLKTIMSPCRDEAGVSFRNDSIAVLRDTLIDLAALVEGEANDVKRVYPVRPGARNSPNRIRGQNAEDVISCIEQLKKERLDLFAWLSFWGENGGLDCIFFEAEKTTAKENVAKVVNQLHKMLTTSAKGAQPRGEEAQRVLSVFVGSLKNPTLETPPAVDEMLSWSVLTPHYEEDVLYPLNNKHIASHFNLPISTAMGMSDLMSENQDGVTVMAWLRSNYSQDWNNLLERLSPALKNANLDPRLVNESDFDEGGPLAAERMQLLHWASYRGQLLARTVKGMMSYETALRLLARIENPNPGISPMRYNSAIEDLVRSKFSYVVASQRYGDLRRLGSAKSRWLARGVEYLLHQNLGLRVAFLDSKMGSSSGKRVHHSVLVRGRPGIPIDDPFNTEELYRIRLPINYLAGGGHGIILGEGKPENQNASIIFCFGEVIQAIDMNQDNYLCEALKMRNLISEFNLPNYSEDNLLRACARPSKKETKGVVKVPVSSSTLVESKMYQKYGHPPMKGDVTMAYERPWPDMSNSPVALVGFREWVFSQDSGALASFAAATEFTFGSMVQRIMTWPGSVRFHYGHPDLWNKIFVMTRGGVSKATRSFHISEDVFAGYNHVLRGGRVKFKEYISCGKGRDMGFDSINSFESKVSGGNGEQVMSRDVHRLATNFDFFRLLSFYHSGPGFFMNSYLVLLSVYANIWMLTMLAVTDTQTLPDPNDDTKLISTITGQETTVAVQQIVQIGMFSIITYVLEMILEYGAVKAIATVLIQVLQGSLAFFVFRTRTTAYFFLSDVQYGGAKYIPTGRGYQLKHNSFVKVYSNYARSHLYYAAELLLLLILLALSNPQKYPMTTWSTWLVTVSIFWAPFWFNPGSFIVEKTKDDFEAWLLWMSDVVDPDTGSTWDSWNKAQLEKPRNDRGTQTNPLATALRGFLGALPTLVLTVGAITNLRDTRWNKWIIFGIITGAFWLTLCSMFLIRAWLLRGRHYRVWRLVRSLVAVGFIAFLVCAIIFIPNVGSGIGVRNIILIAFANFSIGSIVTQVALYLAPKFLTLRSAVDSSYRLLDYIIGYFLFFFLFLFSFLQVFNAVQGALLFNIKFSRKLEEARMMGSNNYITSYVDRATERINNTMKKEIERTMTPNLSSTSSQSLKVA